MAKSYFVLGVGTKRKDYQYRKLIKTEENHMTTEKQIDANKQNALLSTGAITEEGKAIVAKNAIKHGVFVKDLIVSSEAGRENIEEYLQIQNGLIESLNPVGQMEQLLAEKIAVDFWRIKRVLRYETGNIRKRIDKKDFFVLNDDEEIISAKSIPEGYIVEIIMRYERSLQKSITQNIVILKKLQFDRKENGFVL